MEIVNHAFHHASVRMGCGESLSEDGRFFAYYQPNEFARRVQKAGFSIDRVWISEDSLPGRTATRWVNVIARRGRITSDERLNTPNCGLEPVPSARYAANS